MKLAMIGYGQMGHMIEACAKERGHEFASIIDPFAADATHKEISPEAMADVDVAICFTRPDVALENIQRVTGAGTDLVMGTTGWTEKMDEVQALVQEKVLMNLLHMVN